MIRKFLALFALACISLPALADEHEDSMAPKDSSGKGYRNILFLKVNKGKGYRKQAFEMEDAYALMERGVSYISFHLGYRGNDIDNYWLEPVAIVDEVYNRNFSASLSLGYIVKNNLSLGIKGSYAFADTRLILEADLFDLLFNAQTYETNSVSSSFSVAGVIKNFVPLGRAHRMFLVNETNLSFAHSQSLMKNIYDKGAKINKIEKTKNAIGLGISPGFMYFMTKGLSFDFSLNPVIAYFEQTDITNNQTEKGKNRNYGLSFKFMPLNIQFGFSYYFGLDYYKNKAHLDAIDARYGK
ncbi:MAG: hypothetical protein LBS03_05805 [Bacteroidales bacterium]|jgi:hypothetical protein|nr:hypothetical protein [Bacteroidales bacterium]